MNSQRGSMWRKWDLHVHTPESFEEQYSFENEQEREQYDDQWDKYLDELESVSDISVLGVTDYMSIDGYERIVEERENGRLDNFDLVLPNIEFRLDTIVPTGDGGAKRINAHVIFDNDIEVETIRRDFLNNINFSDRDGNGQVLRRERIEQAGRQHIEANPEEDHLTPFEAGCKIITVDFNDILDALENDDFKNRHLVVLAKDGWDGVDWNTQGHLTKERLFRQSDALFSANPNQIEWALGKRDGEEEFKKSFGSPTPCIWGSDAHRYERLCEPDEDRYCWIKADPTFEGLKQVVHEPEKRVSIQKESPCGFIPIHTLSGISIENGSIDERLEIEDQDIPLNSELVTVIGGKGAGKTALLDLIANCFKDRWDRSKKEGEDPEDQNSFIQRIQDKEPEITTRVEFEGEDIDEFSKHIKTEEFFEASDLVYLPQGKIEEYCRDEQRLHEHIVELIKESVEQDEWQMIDRFDNLEAEADDIADDFRSKTSEIYNLNPSKLREERNSLQTNKKQKEGGLQSKISEIRKFEEKHSDALKDNNASTLREELEEIKEDIEALEDTNTKSQNISENLEVISETNELLESLQADLSSFNVDISLPVIQVPQIKGVLDDAEEEVERELDNKKTRQSEIRNELDELDEVEQEYSDLLDEKKAIEDEIEDLESEISTIEDKLNHVTDLRARRRRDFINYVQKFTEIENQYQTIIDQFSGEPSEVLDDISFEPSVRLNEELIEQLERLLDMRSVKESEVEQTLQLLKQATDEDVQEQVEEKVTEFLESMNELREMTTERTQDFEFESTIFDTHLTLAENVYFRGFPMPNLSLGQKGTVLLKILLAESDTPLIIDQPEENLDNEFIYKTLVGAFRDAKLKRQVIIATHNANLVVNTDAEQVIVANYDSNTIDFESGSLENQHIRNEITTILEGGEEAFRKREKRYEIPEYEF